MACDLSLDGSRWVPTPAFQVFAHATVLCRTGAEGSVSAIRQKGITRPALELLTIKRLETRRQIASDVYLYTDCSRITREGDMIMLKTLTSLNLGTVLESGDARRLCADRLCPKARVKAVSRVQSARLQLPFPRNPLKSSSNLTTRTSLCVDCSHTPQDVIARRFRRNSPLLLRKCNQGGTCHRHGQMECPIAPGKVL